jgi:hypothetical protein
MGDGDPGEAGCCPADAKTTAARRLSRISSILTQWRNAASLISWASTWNRMEWFEDRPKKLVQDTTDCRPGVTLSTHFTNCVRYAAEAARSAVAGVGANPSVPQFGLIFQSFRGCLRQSDHNWLLLGLVGRARSVNRRAARRFRFDGWPKPAFGRFREPGRTLVRRLR